MEKYGDIKIYEILFKGGEYGQWYYDDEGKINGGKPFVIYTETVKEFIKVVNGKTQDVEEVLTSGKEGGKLGVAQKDTVFALIKAIVTSENYAEGTVLSRLKDGTIQSLIKKL